MGYSLDNFKDPTTLGLMGLTFIAILGVRAYTKKKNLPPGPPGLPVIGNMIDLFRNEKDVAQYFWSLYPKYGPIISIKLFHLNIIVLQDYDTIKEAFVRNADKFGFRPDIAFINIILRGDGMAATNDQKKLKLHRKFSMTGLRDFGMGKSAIESKIQEENRFLREELINYGSKPWDPVKLLLPAISNIVSSINFGHRFEYSDEKYQALWLELHEAGKLLKIASPEFTIGFLANRSTTVKEIKDRFQEIEKLTEQEIELHRDSFDPDNIRDFVDLFLKQEQEEPSGGEIIQTSSLKCIIRDLFFAGTDTTFVTIQWGLALLTTYPEIQKKCQDEIDQVIGPEKEITTSDIESLPYLKAMCYEIQRFRPIAPLNLPHAVQDDVEFRGYTIPSGSMVIGSIHAVHNNPEYFGQDVDKFRPERFLNDEGEFVKNEYFIPFSIGSRYCIGEILAKTQIHLIFANFLQLFKFERVPDESFDLQGTDGLARAPKDFQLITTKR